MLHFYLRWPLTLVCNLWWSLKHTKVPINTSTNQVWVQSDFIFSNETNLKFAALQLDFKLPSPWYVTSDPHYINNQVWSDFQLFKWGKVYILSPSDNLTSDYLWPGYMNLTSWTWGFPYCINQLFLVPIILKFIKWGHFHIFSLSYNLISDDLWPWYVTFDLINKWGFPCCIFDPNLIEIHQSM